MDNSYSIRTYFKLTRLFMSCCGLWPYQPLLTATLIQCFWVGQHISIFTPEVIKLIEDRHNFDHVVESIPPVVYNIIIALFFSNIILQKQKVKSLLEKIQNDWENLSEKNDIIILTRYADTGKIITLLYIGSLIATGIIFSTFPLIPIFMDRIKPLNESRPKNPLYRVQLYIDDKKYFYYILMHAFFTTTIGINLLIAVDIYFANCIQHICGMFTILRQRLENTTNCKISNKEQVDKLHREIVDCAILHERILDFIDHINSIFKNVFGVCVVLLLSLMSMTGMVMLIKWGNLQEVMRFGLFTMAEVFHLFCYSYHSQDVIDHNNSLYNSICYSKWCETSMKTKIVIKMMFLRCLKPCLIKAMILPFSMENFAMLMKTTFSYFTVMKSCRY